MDKRGNKRKEGHYWISAKQYLSTEAILPKAFDLVDALGRLSSATVANADVAEQIELDTFGAEVECEIELDIALRRLEVH